jgi:hypothetical protein
VAVDWGEYAATSRRLTAIRLAEIARRSKVQEGTATGRDAVEQLKGHLAAQREHLTALALRLREPRPSFGGAARGGVAGMDEAVRRGRDALTHADAEARRAEERGHQPALLPGMSGTARNVLVYLATTLVASVASCGMSAASPDADLGKIPIGLLPWSLCGLPAVAFFGGYFTIAAFGRPRIRTGEKASHSVRLGGLICFGGMWLVWLLYIVASMG